MRGRFAFILLFGATSAFAQTPNASLNATIAAHGGAALNSVNTIQISGSAVSSNAGSQPIVISASMDGRMRIDYGSPVTRSVITTDAGQIEVRGSNSASKPAHVGAFAAFDILGVFGLRRFAQPGVPSTTVGNASVGGRPAVRVKAATANDKTFFGRKIPDEVEVDLDVATGFLAVISRIQYADQSLDRPFWRRFEFSDYRPTQGITLPFQIESKIDGRTVSRVVVTAIIINPALPATLWEKP